jgi:hypothetical protein
MGQIRKLQMMIVEGAIQYETVPYRRRTIRPSWVAGLAVVAE